MKSQTANGDLKNREDAGMVRPLACPCCGDGETRDLFASTHVPANSGAVFETKALALAMPLGPMRLAVCHRCGYIWNQAFEPGLVDYGFRYDISMHHSPVYQRFLEQTAKRLVDTYGLSGGTVMEIACGSGQFLRLLCQLGDNAGIGIDPSALNEGIEPCGSKTITYIRDLYSEKYAHLTADLVCCRHVLEGMRDPKAFLTMIRGVIGPSRETKIYIETPNADYMYTGPIKWSFMYEYAAQMNANSLSRLFAEAGYRVLTGGACFEDGQYVSVEAVPDDSPRHERPERFVASEDFLKNVERYSERVKENAQYWSETMAELRRSGKKVVGWGAGGRAGIFLSMFDSDGLIEYVVDINPLRQGKFMSVTGKQIVTPEFLKEYRPDVVIVMNPTYMKEIIGRVKEMGLQSQVLSI